MLPKNKIKKIVFSAEFIGIGTGIVMCGIIIAAAELHDLSTTKEKVSHPQREITEREYKDVKMDLEIEPSLKPFIKNLAPDGVIYDEQYSEIEAEYQRIHVLGSKEAVKKILNQP